METRLEKPGSLHGILLVDKPSAWTSHDVVARVRRLSGQRKIGHTGTLDPMATGLLVLCLGDATRLVEYMTAHDKRYEGVITLGVRTDTDDAEGAVVERRPIVDLGPGALDEVVAGFIGTVQQKPPAFSALKKDGQRAYAIARRGGDPALPPREVTILELVARQIAFDRVAVTVRCGPGTYIRSLARDMGEALGCGAHLSALRRTAVGSFDVEDAIELTTLEQLEPQQIAALTLPPDGGITEWPAAILEGDHALQFGHGMVIEPETPADWAAETCRLVRVFTADGRFAGVGEMPTEASLRPVKVMANLGFH